MEEEGKRKKERGFIDEEDKNRGLGGRVRKQERNRGRKRRNIGGIRINEEVGKRTNGRK
jgi:hypothetical protein